MTRADHFRQQAAVCEHHAAASDDPDQRDRFRLLAQRWRELADRREASDSNVGADLVWITPAGDNSATRTP
jgi:hypothetical protein